MLGTDRYLKRSITKKKSDKTNLEQSFHKLLDHVRSTEKVYEKRANEFMRKEQIANHFLENSKPVIQFAGCVVI